MAKRYLLALAALVTFAAGQLAYAAAGFDGATDQLSRATNLPTVSTAMTMTGWVRRDADLNDYSAVLWMSGLSGAAYSGLSFTADGTTLSCFGTTDEDAIGGAGQPAQGEWWFVALSQTGTTITCWASEEGSATFTSVTSTGGNFTPTLFTAGNADGGFNLEGAMAYIRVFNSALDQTALEAEKAATAAVAAELFDWRCNTAADCNDISGNGRNPTVGGTLTDETGPSLGGSPAVLSSPTPSGTLGTSTTATIGATTDDSSGTTFYAVVDTAGNISGITEAEIIAGQENDGMAAVAACNSSVSTTTPSCGVTGLTAATGYSYAAVQVNGAGNSNIVTGTFTTAAAAGSAVPVISHMQRMQKR